MKSLALIVLVFLISCDNIHKEENIVSVQNTAAEKKEASSKIKSQKSGKHLNLSCSYEIIDSDYCNNIIDVVAISKNGIKVLMPKGYKILLNMDSSRYDTTIDTSFVVISGQSEIILKDLKYIGAKLSGIPSWTRATINDSSLLLPRGIKVGMTKKEFLAKFNKKGIFCDTIKLNDEEDSYVNTFVFKGNLLKNIKLISHNE